MDFASRRRRLRRVVRGPILLLAADLQPRNYRDNTHPFRQSSHFLYCTGLNVPGLALLMLPDRDILFAPEATMDDVVWCGATPSPRDLAKAAAIDSVASPGALPGFLKKLKQVHTLPPVHDSTRAKLGDRKPSDVLVDAVVAQRNIKSKDEIAEIESALAVTDLMHRFAMGAAMHGLEEYWVAGNIQALAFARDLPQAYQPIVTVRGEILHNQSYRNVLAKGDLLLVDAGAEAATGYASDITRVMPASGRFSKQQAEIYDIVLRAQSEAIAVIRPGISYRDVHLHAALTIAKGLTDAGLMKGSPADAVAAGAHALFFPHGLGHMLGLDVHDMEDLGDVVGYGRGARRSTQFGLNFLRLARPLEAGFVLTVEPGIYFIPALIDQWRAERRHADFINYSVLSRYRRFGGIRIEDDVLVTPKGARVLGPPIPKSIREVEAAIAS